jgi:branched-chain amino acid transport system substrate-binding protein
MNPTRGTTIWLAGALGVVLALGGCRAILGDFKECTTDGDCAARGANLVCASQLCVTGRPALDPRCTVLTTSQDDGGVLRLGSLMPRTRTDAGVNGTGVAREQSLLLAAEQLNPPQRQGIRGRTIELIGCDSQSSAAVAGELAAHLVQQGVVVLFTSGSAETIAAARATVPGGVLQVSVSASAPEITDLPDSAPGAPPGAPGLVWRTSTSDTHQAHVIADTLIDAGTPRTAVILLNDAYGQGLGLAFSREYPASSHSTFLYSQGGDIDTALNSADAYAPTQLLVVGFADDAVRIVNGAQTRSNLAMRPLFFTDAAKAPALFVGLNAPSLVDGALGTAPAPAPLPSDARSYFVTQYTQRFGTDPLAVSATANAFDAMMCVAFAAYDAHDDLTGAALARGMSRLYSPGALQVPLTPTSFNTGARELDTGRPIDVDGASGKLDFNAMTGEAVGPVELWRAQNGAFSTVRVVTP